MVVSTGIGLESDWHGAQVGGGLHVAPTQRSLAASPSGTAREGVDAALTAEIVLPPSVEFAPTLYYAQGGATTFDALPFARGVGDTWTAPIPASSVTTRGLLWYVEVLDRFGQGLRQHSAAVPGGIAVHGQTAVSLRTMPGSTTIWNAAAVPILPDRTSMAGTFDSADGRFLSEWFAWSWNARLQRWKAAQALRDATPVSGDGFRPGKGWYVAVVGDGGVETRTISGRSADPGTPFAIPILPGWNLLASPYNFPIEWRDGGVQASVGGVVGSLSMQMPLVDNRLVHLDVSTQSYQTHFSDAPTPYTIQPGQAWWFYSSSTGELILDPMR